MITMTVKAFINDKRDVINELDPHGYWLLHYLAALNFSDAIKLWIDAGLELNVTSSDGKIPLDIAIIRRNSDAVDTLLSEDDKVTKMVRKGVKDLKLEDSEVNEGLLRRVRLIQRRVRCWLDTKRDNDSYLQAANRLQNAVKALMARKQFVSQKNAARKIQKAVRNWLGAPKDMVL